MIQLSRKGDTHRFSGLPKKLISELPAGGIFLDFGAGTKHPSELLDQSVFLDALGGGG